MITRTQSSSSNCNMTNQDCNNCTQDCTPIIDDILIFGDIVTRELHELMDYALKNVSIHPMFAKYHVYYIEDQIPKKIKYRSIDRKPFYNLKQPVSRMGFKRGQRRNNAKRRA